MKTIPLYGSEEVLEFDERAHAYKWKGKFVPGVTSILKILDKPALIQWAANCAAKYIADGYVAKMEAGDELETSAFLSLCQEAKTAYRRISREAVDVGSAVHKFAERVLVDRRAPLPSEPQVAKGAEAFLSWLHAHNIRPQHVERMVLSRQWYYAGTVDFVGSIDGENCILDFKTSKPFATKGKRPYNEMYLQLAAYAVALEEETNQRINAGWIVRLDKATGQCEPHRIELTDGTRDAWLRVRETHEAMNHLERDLAA